MALPRPSVLPQVKRMSGPGFVYGMRPPWRWFRAKFLTKEVRGYIPVTREYWSAVETSTRASGGVVCGENLGIEMWVDDLLASGVGGGLLPKEKSERRVDGVEEEVGWRPWKSAAIGGT